MIRGVLHSYEASPKFNQLLNDVTEVKYLSTFALRKIQPIFKFDRILIKAIRLNLNIEYLISYIRETKVVILVRNPFDVVISWRKSNFEKGKYIRDRYLSQSDLLSKLPDSAVKNYRTESNENLLLLYMWCIENYLMINSNKFLSDCFLIKYEEIKCQNFDKIDQLFNYLNVAAPKKRQLLELISKKSSTALLSKKNNSKIYWSNSEIKAAKKILEVFNLCHLYNDNDFPLENVIVAKLCKCKLTFALSLRCLN